MENLLIRSTIRLAETGTQIQPTKARGRCPPGSIRLIHQKSARREFLERGLIPGTGENIVFRSIPNRARTLTGAAASSFMVEIYVQGQRDVCKWCQSERVVRQAETVAGASACDR